jgi:uncharacterized protein (TIGR03435 family)
MMRTTPGSLQIKGEPLTRLAQALTGMLGRPVVDRTGLEGTFDLELDYDPESAIGLRALDGGRAPSPSMGPAISTALREQLGLRLESRNELISVVVIVNAEPPSEN